MSKQEEIKQALAAATPGPWAIYKTTVGKCEETLIGTAYDHPQLKAPDNIVGHACGLGGEFVYIRDNDANLIAKAPGYIAYLLAENERLEKRNQELDEWSTEGFEENQKLVLEVVRLRKELEEARKIKFPRQSEGEGGWVIDYKFLERLGVTMLRESDHTIDTEDIELVLLTLEIALGQEGEGNHEPDRS
ncbi:ead/Ea22-like family protein [Paenibacillus taichungensis]|uniref:ead/Ea22-like family protein n=1 Tax=Paenibacillus taichungensis TaxID=484184 RepID=UPI0037F4A7D1